MKVYLNSQEIRDKYPGWKRISDNRLKSILKKSDVSTKNVKEHKVGRSTVYYLESDVQIIPVNKRFYTEKANKLKQLLEVSEELDNKGLYTIYSLAKALNSLALKKGYFNVSPSTIHRWFTPRKGCTLCLPYAFIKIGNDTIVTKHILPSDFKKFLQELIVWYT